MKATGTKNVTYPQRLMIEDCLNAGLSKPAIARKVGVCVTTVYNELHRGAYTHKLKTGTTQSGQKYTYEKYERRYSPDLAQQKYRINMTAKGRPIKLGNDIAFANYVEKRVLKDKLSPCAVLGEINRNSMFKTHISKTTLYRYIEQGFFLHLTMRDLPYYRKKKHYRKPTAKRLPRGTSIEKRPDNIAGRQEFGHWEMDCVIGSTRPTLLTLTERLTRKEIIMLMPNRKADTVVQCLNALEYRYGRRFRVLFKSITVDNGSEFADHAGLERSVHGGQRTAVYYCHPYTSSERGTNERLNRDIRRQLPKGTDFSKFTHAEIQAVEDWVNAYPREMFGFATSAERFRQEFANL